MNPISPFMRTVALIVAFLVPLGTAPVSLQAATYYWDGGTVNIGTNGNGVSLGTAGDWDNTLGENTLNWDQGAGLAHVAWTNANLDTAVFGGTAGTVTLTDPISVGGLSFFSNSGYTIAAGTEGLTFGAGTDNVRMLNVSGTTSTATISGTVTGSGNLVFTSIAADVASTLTFNGTSAGGWSGTTTIYRSMTVSLAVSSQALLNTTGITLNGGNILLTNTATGSENTINRVSNTAAIASYGSGSILIANTATVSRAYTETIGSITHNNGQLSLGFTTIQNAASNTQTLIVGGLTRSGTATIGISGGGSGGGNSIHANSEIRVAGITTSTAANEIIGPWMTAGNATNAQSDWAVYVSDGSSGRFASRAIAASAETTWTSSSATGNYTAAVGNPTAATTSNKLTADRFVNTLRATFAESAAASHTMTAATDTIAFAGHALVDGDVVSFRTAGGLTDNRPYYVINSVAATSFQLSLTPGGSLLDLTSDTEGFITTGLNLNGNTLGLNGFVVGTTGATAIGGGSASAITLPTTTSGNLFLHGAASIWIDSTIEDNGAGVLTLVKSSTNTTLTLSGSNTYTGGTVLNGGALSIGSVSNIGGASANLTFGGTATLAPTAALNFSGGTLTVSEGAFGTITGSGATAFATTTGTGTLRYTSGASTANLNLGNASGFTGNLEFRLTGNAGYGSNTTIQFSSLGDGVGSVLQVGGGQSDSSAPVGQPVSIVLSGGSSPLVFNSRVIEILPRIASNHTVGSTALRNNNTSAANTWVINTDLSYQVADAGRFFELGGSNIGDNAFNGVISNGNLGGTINFRKADAGSWILGNAANSYTGSTTVIAGTLSVSTLANGGSNSSIGASTNAAGSLILNGGTLRYTGGAISTDRLFSLQTSSTINSSGTGAINFYNTGAMGFNTGATTKTLTLTGTNTGNNTIAAAIGNLTLATSIAKTGIGTWVLSGTNSATGTNSLSGGGTLVLDYTTNNNTKLASGAFTVTGGGNLILRAGSAFAQNVTSTTLTAGGGNFSITQDTSGTNTINLNAISRGSANNGATLSLDVDSVATTDNLNNTGGILGGYATVGSNWAKNSTNAADGAIVGLTSGDYTAMPTTGGTGTVNYQLTGAASLSGSVIGNTLRISNDADDQVLNLGASRNLSVSAVGPTGGLLYAGGNNNNYTITGTGTSRLTPQNGNQELIINTYTGTLTVEVPILSSASNSNGAFTKTGLGTLVLTATSDFAGGSFVNQGVLRVRNNTALGAVSSGAQSTFVSNGAALELANSVAIGAEALTITGVGVSSGGSLRNVASNTSSYAGAITIGNGGARINSDTSGVLTLSGGVVTSQFNNVTFGGAGNTTVSTAAISGAGGLVKDGLGTTTLSATNTYTGATSVSNGTLQFAKQSSLYNNTSASWTAANLNVKSGGTLAFNVGGTDEFTTGNVTTLLTNLAASSSATNGMNLGSRFAFDTTNASGGTFTVADVINNSTGASGGARGLTKLGTNTLVLTNTNTYTGDTAIQAGSLVAGGNSVSTTVSGSSVTANASTDFITLAGNPLVNGDQIVFGGTTVPAGLSAGTVYHVRDVSGNDFKVAASPGGTAIDFTTNGTAVTAFQPGVFGGTNSAIVLGNGSTGAGDAPAVLINGTFTVGRDITVGSVTNTAAYNATIGGSNTSGIATYTGNITLGTNAANYTLTLQAAPAGTVEFKTGTWTTNNKAIAIGSSGNTGTIIISNPIATSGGIAVNFGTLELNSAFTGGNLTVASGATLSGTGSVAGTTGVTGGTVNGTGLTLTGVTTFNSTSNVLSGTVTSTNGVTLASGAALANNGALTGTLAIGNGTLTGTAGSVSGAATLNGGMINLTSGSFGSTLGVTGGNWNGAGSVTGLVTSSSGIFTIGSGANLTANGDLAVTGGTIAAGSSTSTITGRVNYTSSDSSSFAGEITGSGKALTMNNASSTLTLTGTNTYTGDTTITAGNLQVGASGTGSSAAGSAVSVNGASAVLSGTGTVGGDATVTLGQIRPGDAAGVNEGTLTFGGALTFNPAAAAVVAALTIQGTTTSNETGDKIKINGALTLSSNSFFTVTQGASWTPTAGQSWQLLDWNSISFNSWSAGPNNRTGASDGFSDGNGNLDLPELTGGLVWDVGSFATNGSVSIVNLVPEPSRALLLLFGMALALFRRRRPTLYNA